MPKKSKGSKILAQHAVISMTESELSSDSDSSASHRDRSHSGSSHHSHHSHHSHDGDSPRERVAPISIFSPVNVTVTPTTTTVAKDESKDDGCTSCFTALFAALKR